MTIAGPLARRENFRGMRKLVDAFIERAPVGNMTIISVH
jgi:hypothetical protein